MFSRRERSLYLFCVPALVYLSVFLIYPIFKGVSLSFYKYNVSRDLMEFNSIGNYEKIFSDPLFWNGLKNTCIWTFGLVAGRLTIGILVAVLLDKVVRFRAVIWSLALIPWCIPHVAAAISWKWMLNPDWGIINNWLLRWGITQQPISFLTDQSWIWFTIISVSIWKNTPFAVMIFLAGLQSIPTVLYEAANIDGASSFSRLRYVTLPLLKPIIVIIAIMTIVWTWSAFAEVYVLTGGGPGWYSTVLAIYVYKAAFRFFRFGYASSIATVMFVVVIMLTIIYLRKIEPD
jgi:multiple sugar transport system permease protein